MDTSVEPFILSIPGQALLDLRRRLELVRWPEQELVPDWSQGAPLRYVTYVGWLSTGVMTMTGAAVRPS